MQVLADIVKIGLYLIMFVSVAAAVGVVWCRNIFYAALCLVVVLLGAAAVFLSVHAEFLAVVQILIYVGAVMTLVIFAVMLTDRFGDPTVKPHNKLTVVSFAAAIVFIQAMAVAILNTPWPVVSGNPSAKVSVTDLGTALMGPYVFPFEVISVILIAALVGSIVIAKKEKAS